MELYQPRLLYGDLTTIGALLYDDNKHICHIAEDVDRGLYQHMPLEELQKLKVYKETAIPYGRYELGLSYSNKFKKLLPIFFNVPAYEGIRYHGGVDHRHSWGCPLVGSVLNKEKYQVYTPAPAMKLIMDLLQKHLKKEKVFVNIIKS